MTKQEAFVRLIEPLLHRIGELCEQHDVEYAADFLVDDAVGVYCTSFNIRPRSQHRLAGFVSGVDNG